MAPPTVAALRAELDAAREQEVQLLRRRFGEKRMGTETLFAPVSHEA